MPSFKLDALYEGQRNTWLIEADAGATPQTITADFLRYAQVFVEVNDGLAAARRLLGHDVRRFFRDEVANEAQGGVSPSTLSSAIDSLTQNPDAFGLDDGDLLTLLRVADLVGTDTALADLLAEDMELIGERRTCSCGMAWADEPGHEDHQQEG